MIGKTLGHYKVTERIGAGGMGVVYKARDTHLDRFAALKVLPPEKVSDPERKRWFIQEAKAASALNHPNIITIYDIDQAEGIDFIAMEYVEGKTLDQRIGHRGLRLNDALKYAVQIADALAKAHSAGIVHRDLKPSNIVVNEDGVVKVLDFGLAKLTEQIQGNETTSTATVDGEGRPITEEGVIVGTVAYMSPEQAEGKKVDARSDIFSLGSVLCEMVTGQKAFQGTNKMSTLSAILHQEPKPVSGVTPAIPADLEKLINRCLRKDPERRWQAMADLRVALQELKEDSDSGRLQASVAKQKHFAPVRLLIAAVGVVAVIVLAAAGWYWLGRHAAEPEAPLAAVPLTSYPGFETNPSFSPDGTDTCPAVSPDGRTLMFTRMRGNAGDSYLLRLGENYEPRGAPEKLAEMGEPGSSAPAWMPDGGEILFVSGHWLGGGLWRVAASLSAKPRRMVVGAEWVACAAISRGGNRLAFVQPVWRTNIWRVDLHGPSRTPGAPFKLILSTRIETSPAFSPDGKRIAFSSDRSGYSEIWVCNSDGSNPAQLTSFGGPGIGDPRWSPDGRNVVFRVRGEIYVISANGGPSRRLDTGPRGGSWPSWSRDSQSIYFDSSGQVWKMPSAGGQAVQITRNEGILAQESPDGKFLYYMKGWPSRCSVWRMPAGGGEETKVLEPVHLAGHFSVGEQGIYYFAPEDEKGHSDINFYDFAAGTTRKILTIETAVYEHIEISPDGRTILYPQIDETGSDLMLVENFR